MGEPPSDRSRQSRETRGDRWTIGELLNWTTARLEELGVTEARTDAQHLLAHALGCSRMDLYVRFHELLSPAQRAGFRELVKRRLAREPVASIEGKRGFHALDLELAVDTRALIPRADTEILVDWVLETTPADAPRRVVDVGTGSGALALSLKHSRPQWLVTACDVSAEALALAKENAVLHALEVEFVESDLLANVAGPDGGWELIVANLPYIPSEDIETLAPEVRSYEPRLALDGGEDGLDLIRRLVAQTLREGIFAPSGVLYLEFGIHQSTAVTTLALEAGLACELRDDLGGIPRVARLTR